MLARERCVLAGDRQTRSGHEAAGGSASALHGWRRTLRERVTLRAGRGRLVKYLLLQVLQVRPRWQADIDQGPGCAPIDVERVGLATRPVEREHQQSCQLLLVRILRQETLELRDHLVVSSELKVGVVRQSTPDPQLLEAPYLPLSEVLERDLG